MRAPRQANGSHEDAASIGLAQWPPVDFPPVDTFAADWPAAPPPTLPPTTTHCTNGGNTCTPATVSPNVGTENLFALLGQIKPPAAVQGQSGGPFGTAPVNSKGSPNDSRSCLADFDPLFPSAQAFVNTVAITELPPRMVLSRWLMPHCQRSSQPVSILQPAGKLQAMLILPRLNCNCHFPNRFT